MGYSFMQIFPPVQHPLEVGKKIAVNKPSCNCRGAKIELVEGTIGKVIKNHSGYWYYLTDLGVTVKSEWVQRVV